MTQVSEDVVRVVGRRRWRVGAKKRIQFDFSQSFAAADNVASEVVTVTPTLPTAIIRSGQIVQVQVDASAALPGTVYLVLCTATSAAGDKDTLKTVIEIYPA